MIKHLYLFSAIVFFLHNYLFNILITIICLFSLGHKSTLRAQKKESPNANQKTI